MNDGSQPADDEPALSPDVAAEASRLNAIALLREKADARSVIALVEALTDTTETARVRDHAFDALDTLGPAAAPAVPALLDSLRHEAAAIRLYAGWLFQSLGPAVLPAVASLGKLAADTSESVDARIAALRSLALVDASPGDVVPALLAALDDGNEWVRLYAVRGIAARGPGARAVSGVAEALRGALGDGSHLVRRAAVLAVAELRDGSPDTVERLVTLICTETLGDLAAEALATLGACAVPALVRMLGDADERTAARAAYALSHAETDDAHAALGNWLARGGVPFAPELGHFYSAHPAIDLDERRATEFERALVAAGVGERASALVDYRGRYPKYELLHYLSQRRGMVLHGSNRTDLDLVEPRWALAQGDEADLDVIYAAKNPFTTIFFAVVDRAHVYGIRHNGYGGTGPGGVRESRQQYSLNADAVRERRWRGGTVYARPQDAFEFLPRSGTWVSRGAVPPAARIPVLPTDFPLLDEVTGFEPMHGTVEPVHTKPKPFLEDARSYVIHFARA